MFSRSRRPAPVSPRPRGCFSPSLLRRSLFLRRRFLFGFFCFFLFHVPTNIFIGARSHQRQWAVAPRHSHAGGKRPSRARFIFFLPVLFFRIHVSSRRVHVDRAASGRRAPRPSSCSRRTAERDTTTLRRVCRPRLNKYNAFHVKFTARLLSDVRRCPYF